MRVKSIKQVKTERDIINECNEALERMRSVDEFWKEVRHLCKSHGLTLQAVSVAIGRSPTYLYLMHSQGSIPSVDAVCLLATILHTTVEELVYKC